MILEAIGAFGGLIIAVSVAFGLYFTGKKTVREEATGWRNNFDAEKASHGITKEHLAAEREKTTAGLAMIEQQEERLTRQGARLAQLDEERKEYAGTKVYEMLQAQHTETLVAFKGISENQRKTTELIREAVNTIVQCFDQDKK